MDTERQWCSSCVRMTMHDVLFEVTRQGLDDDDITNTHKLLSCCGCGTVCMIHKWFGTHDDDILKEIETLSDDELENYERNPRGTFVKMYPSPVSRKEPDWLEWLWLNPDGGRLVDDDLSNLVDLLREIYAAVDGGQYRLAAMGIRALLEQVMIMKIGDIGGFDKKLNTFQEDGYISKIQRDAMRTTLDVGDAATHRAFLPDREQLNTCLDIVEGVMSVIYSHRKEAKRISAAVPPRKPPKLRPV
jgi:hypothetical protein